ncbi:MAG: DNA repair protein RecO [Holdemania massiliensis]
MSEARIEAVILKQQDYRENDALITVLSREHGKLGFVCRGIRKMASKKGGVLHAALSVGRCLQYKEQATLFSLKPRGCWRHIGIFLKIWRNDDCPGDV